MRFYIKTLLKKTINLWRKPTFFHSRISNHIFPIEGIPKYQILAKLRSAASDLEDRNFNHNLGALYPPADNFAAKVFKRFVPLNANHLGNWSITPPNEGTQQLEYEAIHKTINLFGATNQKIEGYITSGATEGNLFSIWTCRSYFEKFHKVSEIIVLNTTFTHYSVEKACKICCVDLYSIPVTADAYIMHPDALYETIIKLIKSGKKGFIITLTLGYTETGSNDEIEQISREIDMLQKKYPKSHFAICIDASFNGLIIPFIDPWFRPFKSKYIFSIVVDYHKFTAVPYPAGMILYRKKLRLKVEKKIRYLDMKDNTILGSRPGAPAAAIWSIIHQLGKKTIKKRIEQQLRVKNYFLNELRKKIHNTEIHTTDRSLSCGIVFHSLPNKQLSKIIENEFWMHATRTQIDVYKNNKKDVLIYKFYFMQHIQKKSVDDFINAIEKLN